MAHWFTSGQICIPACCNGSQLGAGDRRSAVGTLKNTSGRPRNRGSTLDRINRTVSFPKCSNTFWGLPGFIMGMGALSAGIKRPQREADRSPRSRSAVRDECGHKSDASYSLMSCLKTNLTNRGHYAHHLL